MFAPRTYTSQRTYSKPIKYYVAVMVDPNSAGKLGGMGGWVMSCQHQHKTRAAANDCGDKMLRDKKLLRKLRRLGLLSKTRKAKP